MKIRKKNVQHGVNLAMRARAETMHFKSKCKKVNVNSVSALDDSDDDCWFNAVSEKYISVVEANVDKNVTALMKVNDCEVRFQIDSAANVNTICKKFVRKDFILNIFYS